MVTMRGFHLKFKKNKQTRKKKNSNLTEFWKAVQSSWKTAELDVSSSLHFFRIDWSVVEKSDTYLH